MKEHSNDSSLDKPLVEFTPKIIPIKPAEQELRASDYILSKKESFLSLLDGDEKFFNKIYQNFIATISSLGTKEELIQLGSNIKSIYDAFHKCCELKLDPGKDLKKVYLYIIPPKDKFSMPSLNCEIGYQGWLEILWRSELVSNIYNNGVYEGDEFEIIYGNQIKYKHIPKFTSNILKLTYAVVNLQGDHIQIKTAEMDEIKESKNASKGRNLPNSPWNKYFNSMAKVVPMRKLAKSLALAIRTDDEFTENEISDSITKETIK